MHKQHFINKIECFVRRIIRAGTTYSIQSLYTVCYTGVYKARSLNIQIHSVYKKQRIKKQQLSALAYVRSSELYFCLGGGGGQDKGKNGEVNRIRKRREM